MEINDTQTLRPLPPNCSHRDVGDEYGAFQIIVRRQEGQLIFYETYRPYMSKIQESPLQASFLLVHEWLWDYAENAYQSRQANAVLHQEGIDADEVATLFVGLELIDAKSRLPKKGIEPSTKPDRKNEDQGEVVEVDWRTLERVKVNGKWGYVDEQGRFPKGLEPRFESAGSFFEGLASVCVDIPEFGIVLLPL